MAGCPQKFTTVEAGHSKLKASIFATWNGRSPKCVWKGFDVVSNKHVDDIEDPNIETELHGGFGVYIQDIQVDLPAHIFNLWVLENGYPMNPDPLPRAGLVVSIPSPE